MKPTRIATGFTAFTALLAIGFLCFAQKEDLLEAAKSQFEKHNYKEARDLFRKAVEEGAQGDLSDAGFKVIVCSAKLGEWDEALKEADAFIEKNKGGAWEAKATHIRGNIRFDMPHYLFKTLQGAVVRGRYVRGGYREDTLREDFAAAIKDLESARLQYASLAGGAAKGSAESAASRIGAATVMMDLARVLEAQAENWYFRGILDEKKEEIEKKYEGEYDPSWPVRVRVAFCYDSIRAFDDSQGAHLSAVARYRKAMFFKRVGQVRESEKPVSILDSLMADFPGDSLADDALYASAMMLEEKEDFLGAKLRYATLLEKFDKSDWRTDCEYRVREMERPRIVVDSGGVRLPGSAQEITVKTRNLKKIEFSAFPVRLNKVFEDPRNENNEWGSYFDQFLRSGGSRTHWDMQEAEWTLDTADADDHKWVEAKSRVPLSKAGAWVVEARGASVTHNSVLIVSDLAIIRKMDGNRILMLVVDAVTGAGVPSAQVAVREKYWTRSGYRSNYYAGNTDETGLYEKEINPSGSNNKNIQTFAFVGTRYAATGHGSWYWSKADGGHEVRLYPYTDRPVYRPGHTVNFKVMARERRDSGYKNLDGEKMKVEIFDAKNKRVHLLESETGDFGSVSGSFVLDKDAALGVYRISVTMAGRKRVSVAGGQRFRVEEYKKPEFEVAVSSEKPQVKLGEKFRAKINAKYYFGGPVVNAEVKYAVTRNDYYHSYVPSGEFDWLYGRGYGWRPWWYYYFGPRMPQSQEVVASGVAKTDEKGDAFVEIDSSAYADVGKDRKLPPDHLFTISAEVRDESRRTIEGSGQVKVTRSEFYAFIETPRGFYDKGERAKFEIRTLNASNSPVKCQGVVRVWAIKPQDPAKPDAEPEKAVLIEEDLSTESNGLGWFQFVADKAGRYEVEFTARDSWGGDVTGRKEILVVGEGFEGWRFRYSDVEVLTDKRSYEEGETARVMLNTNHRTADILFTIEVGNDIIERRVVDMSNKSVIVPVRIDRKLVPNFFVRVAMFAGGKPLMENLEIFAPPAGQFLDVNVKPGKPEYKPGEKASFEIAVKDRRGEGVQCEVSLGVIDRSVLYIQSEFAPDVRKFFYGDRRGMYGTPDSSLQHGFVRTEEDARFYTQLRTRGVPLGWWGYMHWMDYFGEEDEMYWGVRIDGGGREETKLQSGERPSGGGLGARRAGAKPEGAAPSPTATPAPGGMAEERSRKALGDEELEKEDQGQGERGAAQAEAEAAVRENFADTAFWNPAVVTGKDGVARFEFVMPDSLTSWKASAVAVDNGSKMGNSAAEVVTRKNLIVRLAAPRFFTERDEVVLSGLVNNYLSTDKKARVEFTLEGGCLEAMAPSNSVTADVKAGGVARVDFLVKAVREGTATVTVKAFTDEESDAMKLSFPVIVHGIEKTVTVTGVMRGYERNSMKLDLKVPAERDPVASRLELKVSPSIASCMLDALPYLIEYPYGCVEQTMSRFLPSVVVARTLKELGVDLETVAKKRAEIDATHLSERVKHGYRKLPDPVFETAMLDRVVREGISRIYLFQKQDGGFGWWAGGNSDAYMTAYVVSGLWEAKAAGYAVEEIRIGRAISFLKAFFREDKSLHRRAYIAWVLSQTGSADKAELDAIWERRDDLNHYTKSLLALTLFNAGRKDEAATTVENVLQFVKVDKDNGTCFLDTGASNWWYWYNDRIEATVFLLRAMLDCKPEDPRVHMIVKWLVNNRKGGRWNSTKDTANAIYALARYIKAQDELNPEYTVTVDWPGVGKKQFQVTKSNVFSFDDMFSVSGEKIPAGDHQILITRDGKGSVYFTAHLSYFTKEEDIKGAGHELFVERTYWKLTEKKKQVERDGRQIEVIEWERAALKQGDEVKSGDRIEIRLDIDCKNRYEYLVFEDMKTAGLEPVQLRSGFSYGNLCSNMELRDEKVVFFIDSLDTGKHALTYQMRAEVPGKFHAMPTRAYAMYAPKVGGISDEWRLSIRD